MSADRPDRELATGFADVARDLQAQRSPQRTWARIVRIAVEIVPGCDHAGVSIVHRWRGQGTPAASDDVAPAVDAIQYETGQGPCLDAVREQRTFLTSDLLAEDRWPAFSHRAAEETGVRSMLSFRLFVDDTTLGALNLYSRRTAAFDEQSRMIGDILAVHAAIAMNAEKQQQRADSLMDALESSREIGMAMGILMAGGVPSREEAFDLLRQVSQRLDTKLRVVAGEVVDTGCLPGERPRATDHRRSC